MSSALLAFKLDVLPIVPFVPSSTHISVVQLEGLISFNIWVKNQRL